MQTKQDILEKIEQEGLLLPPVMLKTVRTNPSAQPEVKPMATIEGWYEDKCYRFVTEIKATSTPKVVCEATGYVSMLARPPETYPMVIVPYLSPVMLKELEKQRTSGIDLCGNGIVIIPGKLLVVRSGEKNRFPHSRTIKNIYRGKNSLVARALLIQPQYTTVKNIVELINKRRGRTTFPTVSKALKRLEDDMIITRDGNKTRLLQPAKLLDKLAQNYRPPKISTRFQGKCSLSGNKIIRQLAITAKAKGIRLVLTGASSAERYAVLAGEPIISLYCSQPPVELLNASGIPVKPATRFIDIEMLQTDDDRVYFDANVENDIPYSSSIQSWLELTSGDKRQLEAADQIKESFLTLPREPQETGGNNA